jgi:hypothetical protein
LHPQLPYSAEHSAIVTRQGTELEKYKAFAILWRLALPESPAPSMARSILDVLLSEDHLKLVGGVLITAIQDTSAREAEGLVQAVLKTAANRLLSAPLLPSGTPPLQHLSGLLPGANLTQTHLVGAQTVRRALLEQLRQEQPPPRIGSLAFWTLSAAIQATLLDSTCQGDTGASAAITALLPPPLGSNDSTSTTEARKYSLASDVLRNVREIGYQPASSEWPLLRRLTIRAVVSASVPSQLGVELAEAAEAADCSGHAGNAALGKLLNALQGALGLELSTDEGGQSNIEEDCVSSALDLLPVLARTGHEARSVVLAAIPTLAAAAKTAAATRPSGRHLWQQMFLRLGPAGSAAAAQLEDSKDEESTHMQS